MNALLDPPARLRRFSPGEVARLRHEGVLSTNDALAVGLDEGGRLIRLAEQEPYRFDFDEVLRMVDLGILSPDERVELIDGDLIEMSPQGSEHVRLKVWLNRLATTALAESEWDVVPDAPLFFTGRSSPEPDIYIRPTAIAVPDLRGPDFPLVVEVSVSSLAMDLMVKSGVYARLSVPEYWVVDASRRELVVHTRPQDGAYAEVRRCKADATVSPAALPDLKVRLADLQRLFLSDLSL